MVNQKHILLIDDDQELAELLTDYLGAENFTVTCCFDGVSGLAQSYQDNIDLILLDVMMPGLNGFEVLKALGGKHKTPILMLTAKGDDADRVLGLELGADDYMSKPFSVRELQARVRSQLRRIHLVAQREQQNSQQQQPEQHLTVGELQIDNISHRTLLAGKELDLTSTEFDLLLFLASHPEQVFSREQLLSSVWGYHHSGYEHTVNSHINRLRNKVERNATKPEIVQTVWGVGYKFNKQGVAA